MVLDGRRQRDVQHCIAATYPNEVWQRVGRHAHEPGADFVPAHVKKRTEARRTIVAVDGQNNVVGLKAAIGRTAGANAADPPDAIPPRRIPSEVRGQAAIAHDDDRNAHVHEDHRRGDDDEAREERGARVVHRSDGRDG